MEESQSECEVERRQSVNIENIFFSFSIIIYEKEIAEKNKVIDYREKGIHLNIFLFFLRK